MHGMWGAKDLQFTENGKSNLILLFMSYQR